ncbi:MAG: zinc ribbon domain-containing protein [Dehalococcoidia bacterium]|nr:zinc ribbon domain-containing protein [Dehalococcoidia bacterium]
MTGEAAGDRRYQPDDGCPLFSARLEEHLVAVTRGEAPNRGRFCSHCYTPMAMQSLRCAHCGTETAERAPAEQVPQTIVELLRDVRRTESRWVNGFAYLGVLTAVVGGLVVVLGIPALRDSLIAATIVYGLILLVGSRVLAGVLGGYYGDRIGFERARARLREQWAAWLAARERTGRAP